VEFVVGLLHIATMIPASRRYSLFSAFGGRVFRLLALLMVVAQFGIVAHRIEHYLVPDHMESGEDECSAFAPITDPPALPAIVRPANTIVYFVRFWTARETIVPQVAERLGFRAQAPPV
jgi:hypothetical protein